MSEINIEGLIEYHQSINNELQSIQNRVRNLIAYSHPGEDGRYKEAVLKNLLKKYVPNNISIGSGFIAKISTDKKKIEVSTQVDLLLYDNLFPSLFIEGDFVITYPECVKAIIEVKTNVKDSDLVELINKSVEIGNIVNKKIFNGIFSYNYQGGEGDNLKNKFKQCYGEPVNDHYVNHICLGESLFGKYFYPDPDGQPYQEMGFGFYKLKKMAVSYFISNLIFSITPDIIGEKLDINDSLWFPLPEGKNSHKIFFINSNSFSV